MVGRPAWSQAPAGATPPLSQPAPTSEAVLALLTERVDIARDSLVYVAAVVDGDGSRIVTAGQSGRTDGRKLDGDSVFEIGSITKVFTALLLSDMVQRGEVALTDPVAKYLPPQGRPSAFDGQPITLLDLVTYTSGLPTMPGNFHPTDPATPYADYTAARLYSFLSTSSPLYYPGSHYEYANLGFGLLGHALALRMGQSYEALVVSRICEPLGLFDTRITLTPSMRDRLVPGHDAGLKPVTNWDFLALAGAGALRSTANDLLRFLAACQDRRQTPLAAAFAGLLRVRRQADRAGLTAAGGWFVTNDHGDELVWKDGDTGGYSSFLGYSTRSEIGCVVLANTASGNTTPEVGWHLLNAAFPLPSVHREIGIAPHRLAALVGRYALTPTFIITVTAHDDHLVVQANDQPALDAFPASDKQFFLRAVDAQLTFELGPDGVASAVVLHQNGLHLRGRRLP